MMTRPYLLSTTSSRSSMGGLMMPSGAEVPATLCLPCFGGAARAASLARWGLGQGYQLVADVLDGCVDERDVELAARGELDLSCLQPPPDDLGGLGIPAGQPADEFLPGRGGQEHEQRTGHGPAHLPRPGQVDLQQHRHARRQPFLNGRPRRAIPVSGKVRPFEQLAALGHRVEVTLADEVVLTAVRLGWPRRPGGDGNREPDPRRCPPQTGDHRALADAGRPGEHGEPRRDGEPHRDRGLGHSGAERAVSRRIGSGPSPLAPAPGLPSVGQISPPNSFSRAARWLAPRPRTRRDSAMPSRSIICMARTLPTPGMDWSSADTFIFPMTSSVWPSLRTWGRVVEPCLSRFFTSARSLRALAAFSRAAARCSGVSGGRATRGHLGFRIEKVAPRGETSEFSPHRQREPPFAPAQIIQFDAPYNYEHSA